MSKNIADIEGIGPVFAEKLANAGVKTVEKLLETGASRSGRKSLADTTGIDDSKILKWVNMADLYRIKGIGSEYAELMEAAGVDTVKELRNRNAANLSAKMIEINETKKLVRREPNLSMVEDFVNQAKQLDPIVTY